MEHNSRFKHILDTEIILDAGFFIVITLTVLGLALQLIRGFDGMEAAWSISTGMEICGLFISAICYFGFLNSKSDDKRIRTVFASLFITCSFSMFWDELAWLVQSVPKYALVNRLSNAFLYTNSFIMTFMFWRYLIGAFNIKTKATQMVTRLLMALWVPATISALANVFVPIYYSVDSMGTYHRETLYPLHMLYYVIAIVPATITILKAKVAGKEKLAAFTFYFFPILGIVISMFVFGISTSAVVTIVPVMINYSVVMSRREQKYAVTQNGIQIATGIQRAILPRPEVTFPDRTDFDIAASMTPALTVGGDFYDFFMLDDDHLVLLIADVSDKGIPAALFMTISKVFMKTRIQMGGTPSEIMAYADERIASENDASMFVTLWLAIIDLRTGHVEACNAGHDYPAIFHLSEGYTVEKTPHGAPIAFIPGNDYPGISFDLKPGESIFLYTDGLVEAKRKDGKRFGVEKMLEVLNGGVEEKAGDENCERVISRMKEAVEAFVSGEPQYDDMTMVSFTYKGR